MIVQPTISDLVSVLFRRKKSIIFTALFFGALGAAYLLLVTPIYRSEGSVVVRFDEKAVPDTNMAKDTTPFVTASNDRHEVVLAHTDILSSPDLARSVIGSVGLGRIFPKIIEDPPKIGTPMDVALTLFAKNFLADPEPQGDVINLTFNNPDPHVAQDVLNEMITGYMQREGAIFSASEYEFDEQQKVQAAKRLQIAQDELSAYKAAAGITAFDDQITETIKLRHDVSFNLQNAAVSLEQAQRHRDVLKQSMTTVPSAVANSASEKYHAMDDAQGKLADLNDKERQMLTTYRPDSPMLAQLRASIATAKAEVAARHGDLTARDASAPNVVYQGLQTDYLRAAADAEAYQKSVELLRRQVDNLDKQLSQLEMHRAGLNDRTRAVDIADAAYRAIALHVEDARVSANRLLGGLSHGAVLSAPTLPYLVAKPRYHLFALAFALGAVVAGLIMGFLLEFIDDRFVTAQQVMHSLDVPVLATFDAPN